MYVQVSRCYYHPGRGAVAICAKCGVGICRDCAVKDDQGIILCYKCGNEKLRQEHEEYRARLKESGGRFKRGSEFIVPGIIGILIVVGIGAIVHYGGINNTMDESVFFRVFLAYFLFSIPFCYIVLSDLFAPKYDTIDNKLNNWCVKIVISLVFGGIVFTFLWVRFIIRKIASKKNNA